MKNRLQKRSGITLIETLTAVGLVSMFAALSIPAVQAAREAARKSQCSSNLRQIGLAISGYHADNMCYPPSILCSAYGQISFYSANARLLPYLDNTSLFNAINFGVTTSPAEVQGLRLTQKMIALNSINSTVFSTGLSVFLCPSDAGNFSSAGCNYRGNAGVGPAGNTSAERPDSGNGIFPEQPFVTAAFVTDGLSHTAAFSERVRGSGALPLQGDRDFHVSPTPNEVYTADISMLTCALAARRTPNTGFVYSGKWWFWTGRERTLYNHAQTPNGAIPDCLHGSVRTALAMATARSLHSSGVNVEMADGSVRFIVNSIDRQLWRAFGTRNGGDLAD
jgi:type II secretory pathway pseudopilin PulG